MRNPDVERAQPLIPFWSKTAATSTTAAVIYLPPEAVAIKLLVDTVRHYVGIGRTRAAPTLTAADTVDTLETFGTPTGGTFTLMVDNEETGNLTFDESAADVITAANLLDAIVSGDLVGSGGALPNPITLTWGGAYDNQARPPKIEIGESALTGGTNRRVTVRRTTVGGFQYGYQEAATQEVHDLPLLGRESVEAARGRYLYIAAVSATGNYFVTAYKSGA